MPYIAPRCCRSPASSLARLRGCPCWRRGDADGRGEGYAGCQPTHAYLQADGVSIGQGPAIMYIAMTHGLAGANALETAQIMSIKEALSELNLPSAPVPYGSTPSEENLAKFFEDETANDYSGMAVRDTRGSRMLK